MYHQALSAVLIPNSVPNFVPDSVPVDVYVGISTTQAPNFGTWCWHRAPLAEASKNYFLLSVAATLMSIQFLFLCLMRGAELFHASQGVPYFLRFHFFVSISKSKMLLVILEKVLSSSVSGGEEEIY